MSSAFFSRRFRYQADAVIKPSIITLLGVAFVIVAMPVCAEENPAPPAAAAQSPSAIDPAAATKAWLATVPRDKREKSDAYFEGRYWLLLWNFLLTAAICIFLLESRISAGVRDFAERVTKVRSLQIACYAIPYFLIVATLTFPLNLYENFLREHQYGLATQSFLPWFREQLIGFGLTIIGGTILLIALYAVFRKAPRTWWAWATAVMVMSISSRFSIPINR